MARFVGDLLKDHAEQIWVDEDWRVDATDEKRLILFTMHLFASDTSATIAVSVEALGLPRRFYDLRVGNFLGIEAICFLVELLTHLIESLTRSRVARILCEDAALYGSLPETLRVLPHDGPTNRSASGSRH